jgi:hypothetical protein
MQATALPLNEIAPQQPHKPPTYGSPQRDAIGSIVDGLVDDLCQRITGIRETLDQIEQQALQSAADAKGSLSDHVGVCVRLSEEVSNLQTVVSDIRHKMER